VVAWGGRPHADALMPEEYVQVKNMSTGYCMVDVYQSVKNDAAYYDCPECAAPSEYNSTNWNWGRPTANKCKSTFDANFPDAPVALKPCGEQGSCNWFANAMPTVFSPNSSSKMCCDNGNTSAWCHNTADTSSEFCAYYEDILVRVTKYRASEQEAWQDTESEDQVVCAEGKYRDDFPEAPYCAVMSYCSRPFGTRLARYPCVNNPGFPQSDTQCDEAF
jgi:hypothetical protein